MVLVHLAARLPNNAPSCKATYNLLEVTQHERKQLAQGKWDQWAWLIGGLSHLRQWMDVQHLPRAPAVLSTEWLRPRQWDCLMVYSAVAGMLAP